MSKLRINAACSCAFLSVLCLACSSPASAASTRATAAGAGGSYVTLLSTQQLHAWPETSAPSLGTASHRDFLGRPTVARVFSTLSTSGQRWVRLDACGVGATHCQGWVPEAATAPAPDAASLSPSLLARISAQAGAVGASVVIVNADNDLSLYARSPERVQSLASVTKIFVTGLALRLYGLSVSPLLAAIMVPSNNELAASLNARVGGSGNVNAYAASLGANVNTVGGNGLIPASRASTAQTVRFLLAMRQQHHFGSWEHDLPLAGHTGTLAGRMAGTAADGRCSAKTGTLDIPINVSNLAGYCHTAHHNIVFAIFTRNADIGRAHAAQDAIVATLAASY